MASFRPPITVGNNQHGGALLVMLVILVMGIATVFVSSLRGSAILNCCNHSSVDTLVNAKEVHLAMQRPMMPTNKVC